MASGKNISLFALGLAVVALGGMVAFCCVFPRLSSSRVPREYGDYRGYVSKPPFYVLVNKEYPANNSALFAIENSPLVFSKDQLKDAKTRASMSVGTSFSAHVLIKSTDEPSQFSIMIRLPNQQEKIMQDIDLNGTWDTKILMPDNKRFIYIDNAWLEVEKISGVGQNPVSAVLAGRTYNFDSAKGIWVTDAGQKDSNHP